MNRTRTGQQEPEEVYFEDALAGEAPVPVGRRVLNVVNAALVLLAGGFAVLIAVLWNAP